MRFVLVRDSSLNALGLPCSVVVVVVVVWKLRVSSSQTDRYDRSTTSKVIHRKNEDSGPVRVQWPERKREKKIKIFNFFCLISPLLRRLDDVLRFLFSCSDRVLANGERSFARGGHYSVSSDWLMMSDESTKPRLSMIPFQLESP